MDLFDQTIQDKGGPSNQTPSCARACTNGGYNSPAYLRITSTLDSSQSLCTVFRVCPNAASSMYIERLKVREVGVLDGRVVCKTSMRESFHHVTDLQFTFLLIVTMTYP